MARIWRSDGGGRAFRVQANITGFSLNSISGTVGSRLTRFCSTDFLVAKKPIVSSKNLLLLFITQNKSTGEALLPVLLVVLGHLLVEVLWGGRDEAVFGQIPGAVLGLVVVPQLGCRSREKSFRMRTEPRRFLDDSSDQKLGLSPPPSAFPPKRIV